MEALVLTVSTALGMTAGSLLMRWHQRRRIHLAQMQAAAAGQQVRTEAAEIRTTAIAQSEQLRQELSAASSALLESERAALVEYEEAIAEREQSLDVREQQLTEATTLIDAQGQALDALKTRLHEMRQLHLTAPQTQRQLLEERSGLTGAQAVALAIADRVSKAALVAQMQHRRGEEQLLEEAPEMARRLISTTIDRYNGVSHLERIQNAIPIADPALLDQLTTPTNPAHQALVEAVGCDFFADDSRSSICVRGDDPLAREIGRRLLHQLVNAHVTQVTAERVRATAAQVRAEVDREVVNAGRKAFRLLKLEHAHPDIIHLVGRLKYRLSHSQNQWKHAIEVAYLAGLLATELGLDVHAARRGGLLHDIGKAMTHDHEGSHAVLGAEVARRCGESEDVINAIVSHHNDEPMVSMIAHIVTAADAISGARPGARREAVTQYLERIRAIQDIADATVPARRVDIMQAGREVRVVVAGEERGAIEAEEKSSSEKVFSDADLAPLAAQLAREIENRVTFPGQIRVTVIRESRAVSIAH